MQIREPLLAQMDIISGCSTRVVSFLHGQYFVIAGQHARRVGTSE